MYSPKIINIGERFQSAYGFVPVMLTNEKGMPGGQYLPAFGVKTYDALQLEQTFEDVAIYGNGHDLEFKGNMISKSGSLGKVFAPPPMISYRRAKKLIITNVDGTDTEVVERFNNGVWEMTIQGLLVDMEEHLFPKDKLTILNDIFEIGAVFNVTGEWFEALKIDSIYLLEFMPGGVQGYMDTVTYTIVARSIKPVEFFLNGEA